MLLSHILAIFLLCWQGLNIACANKIVKKPITKAQIRDQLSKDMNQFLDAGGHVDEIPRGTSGWHQNAPLKPDPLTFDRPKENRTYVPEVVAALDARREAMKKRNTAKKPVPRRQEPQKKLIYDDFGEPLRWVWVEPGADHGKDN